MTLIETLAEAAVAAIRDVGSTLEAEAPRVRYLAVELELANGGHVVGAVAWIERRVDVRRRLGRGEVARGLDDSAPACETLFSPPTWGKTASRSR